MLDNLFNDKKMRFDLVIFFGCIFSTICSRFWTKKLNTKYLLEKRNESTVVSEYPILVQKGATIATRKKVDFYAFANHPIVHIWGVYRERVLLVLVTCDMSRDSIDLVCRNFKGRLIRDY